MPKPFIVFITGQSAAGKTTAFRSLRRKFARDKTIRVHDIDENGIPKHGRGHWRLYRIDELLAYARDRHEAGKSTIICGIALPHEVIDSSYYKPDLNIHYVMLRISQRAFSARIRPRLEKWGELDALPSWKKANSAFNKTIFNQVHSQKNHLIINSEKLSKKQVAEEILSYIKRISQP